jgi:ABC-type bacteriocin/lantibiotic exporter with double-glycine peptidase domain
MRVPFFQQIRDGYCLPACAQMALAYHGIVVKQDALIALLNATDEGAPFSRITRIEKFGVRVQLQRNAKLDAVIAAVNANAPSIVAVNLLFLPYSMEDFDHAVLVTDANADEVSLLDPATETGAFAVRTDAFLSAWTERDCALAVIRAKR